MKNQVLTLALLIGGLMTSTAHAQKPAENPACVKVVEACESKGFEKGDHKKNGHGLWIDCVGALAKGKTIEGISISQADAKACHDVAKAARMEKKK